MTWEIWFSESNYSTAVFAQGHRSDAGTLEPDARLIATFEAETVEEARAFKDKFLYAKGGFFDKRQA